MKFLCNFTHSKIHSEIVHLLESVQSYLSYSHKYYTTWTDDSAGDSTGDSTGDFFFLSGR